MKERILRPRTEQRGLFLIFGVLIMIEAIVSAKWLAVLFGAYFAVMSTVRE